MILKLSQNPLVVMLLTFRGGDKPLKTRHFACSLTLALTLALTLSLALSFSSVLPAFSQEPADDHSYTLTKIEAQDPSNLPANTITKYEWSETENKLTPVYYRVDLKQTDYGHTKDYDDVKTYDITRPIDPNSDKNAFEYAINYYVNNDSLSTDRITTDQLGKDIDMDFVGLKDEQSSGRADGGAIYNEEGTIGNITGDFIGNYAKSENRDAGGGAIYNEETIGDITGDFIGNYVFSSSDPNYNLSVEGGAIYNEGKIGHITGVFIGNYAQSESTSASGGAIYNDGTIENITGNFLFNHVESDNGIILGGAIYNGNNAHIDNIVGDFVGNYFAARSWGRSSTADGGGAIYNSGTIGDITGDFIANIALSTDNVYGGAIYNRGTIGNITGDFIDNAADVYGSPTDGNNACGGAIYNVGYMSKLGNINANFIGNYGSSSSYTTAAYGGAIYNEGTIGDITGAFIRNYISAGSSGSIGGAIYNEGTIGDITGDFIGNYVQGDGAYGGAIYNEGTIGDITGDFIGNYASSSSSFFSSAYGGAIYNSRGTIGRLDDEGNLIGGIYGSFINNHATTTSDSDLALGGAVYTTNDMNFIADNKTTYFSGNYTQDSRGIIPNAIFVQTSSSKSPTIKLQAQNNGTIVFNDQIDGGKASGTTIDRTTAYNLALTGDNSGTIYLNNSVINAKVTSENINLNLGKNNVFEQSDFTINSGSLGFINNIAEQQSMKSANINGNINMAVDVDLQNKQMDTLPSNVSVSPDAHISVNYLNLLNDASSDSTSIKFADSSYSNQVSYSGPSPIAYSPIYKYDVSYSTNPEDNLGYFFFNRASSSSGNPSDAFNPAVLTPSVATQAGAYTTQLQTFNYAFQHSDSFMNIPSLDRLSIINNNKYALNTTNFSPLLTPHSHNGFWVKPYASFESIPLNNGPTVSNINYGTLIGYDSDIKQINHGFNRVLTAYIGYNGASQRYQGVDAYQNGGILGSTATFYKGNFFNATTVSVGASVGDATTMYGSENYTMLMAGIGNKFGYNFEFKQGKYILQPNFLMSYSFINTFDYTNAANVRIESDPLHALQLSPGIKFIMNTKNGWQPYLAVNMTWNILDETKVTANDVRLPSMSIDPYVSYGAGIQKCFKDDRFTAYGQAMVHNGGRNGVSLTAGFRWRVGKD